MFPPFSRLLVAVGLFFTAYFLVLANNSIFTLTINGTEWIGVLTVFTFLLSLRIADEFKDLDSDYVNFPNRPLPSGRVTKQDLIALLLFFQVPTIALNIIFMNNYIFFVLLYAYGILMSFWFFAKKYIKSNLTLALITHNPVQILLISYIVSFVCIKYGLTVASNSVILVIAALYLPGLIWEISRKIRSPKEETAYTTYSKIWGYKRATVIVFVFIALCTLLNALLVINLSSIATLTIAAVGLVVLYFCGVFIGHPNRFKLISKTTIFIYSQELILLCAAIGYVLWNHV
jgi:4-hydroxybenzoate polyprenyltransferase